MKNKFRKTMVLFVVAGVLFSILPIAASAADASVAITDSMDAEHIETVIEDAFADTSPGDTLTENPVWEISGAVLSPRSVGYPVRFVEADAFFDTLGEAVIAANAAGFSSATLVVSDSTTEASEISVTSNVTIIGTNGSHVISLAGSIWVQGGGALTLGDGTDENFLTFLGTQTIARVTDGTIQIKDGVVLRNTRAHTTIVNPAATALVLDGSNASGAISGGQLEGGLALLLQNGARLSEINGGTLIGKESAAFIDGAGTRIDVISGGTFLKTDDSIIRFGFYLASGARIGEISGGTFDAVGSGPFVVWMGGWVDEISGGEFISRSTNSSGALIVFADPHAGSPLTGVNEISGGRFKGTHIGIWIASEHARINRIVGGVIEGERGLQLEQYAEVLEISGGTITGIPRSEANPSYGILNVGRISSITGQVEIIGNDAGIWNFSNGWIGEISGGIITSSGVSNAGRGITNAGTIDRISGGTVIGNFNAINNTGTNPGALHVISGGVFWSKLSTTITLSSTMQFEPELAANQGMGRYRAGNGNIFNNENRVIFPGEYYMSTQTEPVDGIDGVPFRYLVKNRAVTYAVAGPAPDSASLIPLTEVYEPRVTVSVAPDLTVEDEMDSAWVFKGWATDDVEIIAGEFIMPFQDVVMVGTWEHIRPSFTVAFLGNGGTVLPEHAERVVVPPEKTVGADMPPVPDRMNYTFTGWNTEADGSGTPFTATTEVADYMIVYAQWSKNEGGGPGPGEDLWRQAFLIGTPDGLIHPNGNITRAEVATIFFRLIEDEVRAEYWVQENPFSDVQLHQWFNNAISTTTNMGLFEGIGDNMFVPNRHITRGELAVILVRFMDQGSIGPFTAHNEDAFSDLSGWMRTYINRAVAEGWVSGYPDGTFRPDQPITRAETAAMINRIFRRLVESPEDLLPDMIVWPDNPAAVHDENLSWYYLYIQSATNSYTYEWKEYGEYKKWLSIIEPRDWSVLERPASRPDHIFQEEYGGKQEI